MAKLKFDSLSLNKFNTFVFVPKKRILKHDGNKKLTPKLVRGVCMKEEDEYKIRLDVRELKPDIIDKGQPDILVLDFTEESYELKGVNQVFSKVRDNHGHYVRYIRNDSQAKFSPGNKETLVPFCDNWVCNGYIVRRNGKLQFDFNDCISLEGYDMYIADEEEKI